MDVDLHDRVAVVTGAATGLGAATARMLAASGADLLLHYRSNADSLERVANDCRELGRRVETRQADFASDPGTAADVVDAAQAELGRMDILVNNAAVTTVLEPFETHSRELLEEVLDVNVVAPFLATQAAARHMIRNGRGGRIINIGSVHARTSAPGYSAYEASKGAIATLTASMAIELGEHRITVNCVAPGAVFVERYGDDWDEDWFVSRTPVGRMGEPDDIAAMVCYLAGEQAGFITGETIFIDGGMTRRMPLVK